MEVLLVIIKGSNINSITSSLRFAKINRSIVSFIPFSKDYILTFPEKMFTEKGCFYTLIPESEKPRIVKSIEYLREFDNDSTEIDCEFVKGNLQRY